MKYPIYTKTYIDYSVVVENIRKSEMTRDFSQAITAFQPVWDNLEIDPDFSDYTIQQQAELYRLSGYFLTHFGKHKNRVNFQERGKNLLTKAIEIYKKLQDFNGVADAQNVLAMCYIHESAFLEADAILELTVADYLPDKLNLTYLQNRGNLLISKIHQKRFEESLRIIDEIIIPMEFCSDKKACFVFNENAGIIFKGLRQFNRAIAHYQKAIKFAEEIGNLIFLSSTKNNLAHVYCIIGRFDLAHKYEDEALKLAVTHSQLGMLPHFLDTEALIYFEEGKIEEAIVTIDKAIDIFKTGEDVRGLADALWNKCIFLLSQNKKIEALKLFSETTSLAWIKMGEYAVDNLTKDLAELIHVKQNGSLEDETRQFRRFEVVSAIRKANYELKSAAANLKIELSELTQIIDTEFPELYEEINIERFSINSSDTAYSSNSYRRNISELYLQEVSTNLNKNYQTYFISKEILTNTFETSEDRIFALEPIQQIRENDFILLRNKLNPGYLFGKVQYDSTFDLYYLLENGEPVPFSLDEVDIIGKAFAFLPFSEIDNETLEFQNIEL